MSARHGAAPQRRARRRPAGGDRHAGRCRRGARVRQRSRLPTEDAAAAALELIQRFEYPTPASRVRRRRTRHRDGGDGSVRWIGRGLAEAGAGERPRGARRCRAPAVIGGACAPPSPMAASARLGARRRATTTNCCSPCRRRATPNCGPRAARLNLRLTAIGELRRRRRRDVVAKRQGIRRRGVRGCDHFAQASTQITV